MITCEPCGHSHTGCPSRARGVARLTPALQSANLVQNKNEGRHIGLRFNRGIRIAPGVRLNLSKSGASVSVSRKGAWITKGHGKTRTTVGLPGAACRTPRRPATERRASSATHPCQQSPRSASCSSSRYSRSRATWHTWSRQAWEFIRSQQHLATRFERSRKLLQHFKKLIDVERSLNFISADWSACKIFSGQFFAQLRLFVHI